MASFGWLAPVVRSWPLLAGLWLLALPEAAAAGRFLVFGPETLRSDVSRTILAARPGTGYVLRVEGAEPGSRPRLVVRLNGVVVVRRDEMPGQFPLERPVDLAARNLLEVRMPDYEGHAVRVSILGEDDRPPTITALAAPSANAAGWHSEPVTVRFVCADDRSGVDICPPPVRVDREGIGQTVSAVAVDKAGNRAAVEVRLSLDWTPPGLFLESPAEGLETGDTGIEVAGTASDAGGLARVEVDGIEIAPGDRFSRSRLLRDGENPITVAATDLAGNTTTIRREVVLVPAPAVAFTWPPPATLSREPTVEVRGTARGVVAVEVDGVPAVLSKGTFRVSGIPLDEGSNTLTAVALDRSGRRATASVLVIRDSTPPRVAIHTPVAGSRVTSETVTVAGMVNDLIVGSVDRQEPEVRVNGVAAEVDNRSFLARDVPLAPGETTLTAVATDLAGNASVPVSVAVRRIAPIPGRPNLRAVSGDLQEAAAGTELPEPLEVELRGPQGEPLAGRPVLFRVAENDGAVRVEGDAAPAVLAVTDAAGRAWVAWRLGLRAGPGRNRVEATAEGASGPVSFMASGRAGEASALVLDGGNRQRGLAGQRLPGPLTVVATDAGHNRLEGVSVTFRVADGGGSLDGKQSMTVTTDVYGRALAWLALGPEPGVESNRVEAGFPESSAAPVVFLATSELAGDPAETRVSGVVLDGTDQPVPGVTAKIEGTALVTWTDAQGQFMLVPAPVGTVRLVVDGSTAEREGSWPSLEYEMVTVPGRDNRLERPVYLLPLDLQHGAFVDETRGGTVTLPELPGFALEIAPGSATFPGGGRGGLVSVTPVHADKIPMVPNFGQQPRLVVTIQPAGVRFDPPARLTVPNVDGLPPSQVTEMYSFDHQLGMFVSIGTGTVSADGSVIRSDPGMGVVEGGWHCSGNPAASGSAEAVKVEIPPLAKRRTIAVGETASLSALGTPEGTYSWKAGGGTEVAGPSDLSFVTVRGVAPGAASVQVTYKCKHTDATDTDDAVVNVIGVEVAGVDACSGRLRTRLLGKGSGLLTVKLGDTTVLSETRSDGDYEDLLDLAALPAGTKVTSVEATWKVEDATARHAKTTDFLTLGVLRHLQVNIPDERDPSCQDPPEGEPWFGCFIREVEMECLLCPEETEPEKECAYSPFPLPLKLATALTDGGGVGRVAASRKGCIDVATPDDCVARNEGLRPSECPDTDIVTFWKEVDCVQGAVGTVTAPEALSGWLTRGSRVCIVPAKKGDRPELRTVAGFSQVLPEDVLEHVSQSGACYLDADAFPPSVTLLPGGQP